MFLLVSVFIPKIILHSQEHDPLAAFFYRLELDPLHPLFNGIQIKAVLEDHAAV